MDAVEKRVMELVSEMLGVEPGAVSAASELSAIGADSLDIAEIAMEVESEFAITVSDDEMGGWKTVADIVASVTKARGASQ